MFNFNKAFVPLALELRGKIKECIVILSELWANAAVLPEGEKNTSFLPLSDSHKRQCYPWATSADKLDPTCQVLNLPGERQGAFNHEYSVNEHHDGHF